MAKEKTIYSCQGCGNTSHKWLGKCPDCGGWNTFLEEKAAPQRKSGPRRPESSGRPEPISELRITEEDRVQTGIAEFDRVLGGGIVPGSAILIGGDPGIGKSTILLQAMSALAGKGLKVLYVTGEESSRQIRLRGERLGAVSGDLLVYPETSLERIIEALREVRPAAVVVDSVQTIYSEALESSPGSVSQVREISARLTSAAKSMEVPVFLVGHVTKEGAIAGPKVLEHMVDTVLYFEGERGHAFRILRAVKNRFGSVMEIGVFEMKEEGLREVSNPSEVFLAERPEGASGSAVVSSLEGTRTILVEVQSLVCPTLFGMPRRTVVGVDYNKVMLLAAVLEKKAGVQLANHDIFIKVAGGLKLEEPAVDLGVLAAIASNYMDTPIEPSTVIFGEVGLAGEVRAISQVEPRIREAAKLGFKRCIMPRDSLKGLKGHGDIVLDGVSTVKEALEGLFSLPVARKGPI
ncbi:MAG: DNA repair protein RadA [Deltaproteobacteria bacterium]|nr:DNA repair protein RadA [Deltaproteobacteria bacterium]MBZ0219745.1 DNA repair protein RadA [Deltaproteobacteria bacterium]